VRGALAASLLFSVTALGLAQPVAPPVSPLDFLRTTAGFSSAEMARFEAGGPVARVLDTDRREVAIVGAIRINAPVDAVLAHYRNVSLLGRSSVVQQVGTFSTPPRADDLRTLAFEDYDLKTIRGCTPGDCGVRLSGSDMAALTSGVNWHAPDWRDAATAAWRRLLAEYAGAYLARGRDALPEYLNKAEPLSVARELDVLFEESTFFDTAAPAFMHHVRHFPAGAPHGVDGLLYWTKDNFGVRPVFSITHMLLYKPPDGGALRPLGVIAGKQIYATHYFDAGLALTAIYPHASGGVYIVSVNRARTRSLTSLLRAPVRSTVRSRSREAMEKVLRSTKETVERGSPRARGVVQRDG
jgi:hypothetical protein